MALPLNFMFLQPIVRLSPNGPYDGPHDGGEPAAVRLRADDDAARRRRAGQERAAAGRTAADGAQRGAEGEG